MKIALILLGLPIAFLSMFLFGEVIGGDISGLGHLLQIIPIFVVGYFAFKFPKIGGSLLIIIGLGLTFLYIFKTKELWQTKIIVSSLLFLPLTLSGIIIFNRSKKYKP